MEECFISTAGHLLYYGTHSDNGREAYFLKAKSQLFSLKKVRKMQ